MVLIASVAAAHGALHPRHAELHVFPGSLEISFFLELPGPEAAGVRRLFDRDRDGRLSGEERAQLTSFVLLRARGGFRVRLDERELPLEDVERHVDGLDATGRAEPLLGRLRLRAALTSPLPLTLSVRDEGQAAGHLPLALLPGRVAARLDLVPLTRRPDGTIHDLPPRREIRLELGKPPN
jgi:hypothetical protein